MINDVVIVIPAYNPDSKFISFCQKLKEAGYESIIVIDDESREDTKTLWMVALDQNNRIGYLPLDNDKRFALTGMVGIGEYVFHQKITNQNRHHNSAWGYRAGAGFIYRFSNNISMRMTAKYVGLDKIADFDHQVSYQIGLRYSFTKD